MQQTSVLKVGVQQAGVLKEGVQQAGVLITEGGNAAGDIVAPKLYHGSPAVKVASEGCDMRIIVDPVSFCSRELVCQKSEALCKDP